MRFYSLTKKDTTPPEELKAQFDAGHQVGVVCVGKDFLFVRKRFRTYFVAYGDAERIFRRVQTVQVNMCCEQGDLQFDYLVVMLDGKEVLEAQLPGAKAARLLMEELKETGAGCSFMAPERREQEAEA